ncbi:MAG: peptide chain release factor N(5)-glutamine methyltransferase [Cohaesibacter sp.]|nr:peptide chain release factor N(5)-glutamine methyltransferase [Cohaesibacter sp.]
MRLDQAIAHWAAQFKAIGIESSGLDARLIVQKALGFSDMDMILKFDHLLPEAECLAVENLAKRRLKREPVAHLLGYREFWGLNFHVNSDTLVPRPDSELLIETALDLFPKKERALTILDIGTGSGCLLLSLLSCFPNAFGVGIDMSDGALEVAQKNATDLGFADRCSFVKGDYSSSFCGGFDLVLSNPPYLAEEEFGDLDEDVACYDPYSALVSGQSGLEAYDAILSEIADWNHQPHGLIFELGYRQASSLCGLAKAKGASSVDIKQDLAGHDRVAIVKF